MCADNIVAKPPRATIPTDNAIYASPKPTPSFERTVSLSTKKRHGFVDKEGAIGNGRVVIDVDSPKVIEIIDVDALED